jgi:ABC-type antimicrobial peptide transport system permease subunit
MMAFIRAMNNDIMENLQQIGGLSILTIKKKEAVNSKETRNFSRSSQLKIQEGEYILEQLPYTKTLLLQEQVPWGKIHSGNKSTYARIMAVGPDHERIYNINIDKGRPFTIDDHSQKRNVCLIGIRLSNRLFTEHSSPVGRELIVNNAKFTIVGLIKTDDEFERNAHTMLFPYSLYAFRFGGQSGKIDEITIELKNSSFVEQAIRDIKQILLQKHRGIEDFEIESNLTKIAEAKKASSGLKILTLCIAGISLTVGCISIMNIMFAAIGDRIREIGIHKAIGATPGDIFLQFIIEATMLCFVGGIPGMIFGGCITLFPRGFFPFNPSLSSHDYFLAVGFTVFAGIASGLTPAIIAAKMKPTETLKY